MEEGKKAQVERLPPQFHVFLNPYTNVRFTTSCPGCSGKPRQRKLPLAIHVDGFGLVLLNKTCRFCPHCELVIAHRDEVEAQLAHVVVDKLKPEEIRGRYLVMGTVERKAWRRGLQKPLTPAEAIGAMHIFKSQQNYVSVPLSFSPLSQSPTRGS